MAEGISVRGEFIPQSSPPSVVVEPPLEITDTVDLTPEGIREHFSKLQELMTEYVLEERLRGVGVCLDYKNEDDTQNAFLLGNVTNTVTLVIPSSTTEAQDMLANVTPFPSLPPQSSTLVPMGQTVYPFSTSYPFTMDQTIPFLLNPLPGFPPFSVSIPQPTSMPRASITVTTHMDPFNDFSHPYVPKISSKITPRISSFKFPERTKCLQNVTIYDGVGDPNDHLDLFIGETMVERWSMPVWCHIISQNFTGPTRLWYNSLSNGNVDSFEELSRGFLAKFMQQRKYNKKSYGNTQYKTEGKRRPPSLYGEKEQRPSYEAKKLRKALKSTESFGTTTTKRKSKSQNHGSKRLRKEDYRVILPNLDGLMSKRIIIVVYHEKTKMNMSSSPH
ncbi:hypothetical protein R6Q59_013816 [Mikania micrantha]